MRSEPTSSLRENHKTVREHFLKIALSRTCSCNASWKQEFLGILGGLDLNFLITDIHSQKQQPRGVPWKSLYVNK